MRPRLGALAFLALAAAAPVLPGIGSSDQRTRVDASAPPWRSLARLQVPGKSRCTAFVVAPRLVVTAAHCLRSRRLGGTVVPSAIHVLTGYTAGQFARHSLAVAYRLGEDADVAVVTLADPIGDAPLPLAGEDPAVGTAVVLGGYNQDRAEVIEADTHCTVVAIQPGRLVHSCAGTHGTSGAPLLMLGADGMWRVVGVQVAAFAAHAGGIAVPVSRLRLALSAAVP